MTFRGVHSSHVTGLNVDDNLRDIFVPDPKALQVGLARARGKLAAVEVYLFRPAKCFAGKDDEQESESCFVHSALPALNSLNFCF
jgi:hypothetical protein